jgi:pimeloyl-ACP methyl ester carboxylesterase
VVLILVARLAAWLSRLSPRAAAEAARLLTTLTRRARRSGLGRVIARHRVRKGEVVVRAMEGAAVMPRRRVLLVHGWNATSSDWTVVAEQLAARGVQVFAADMPGHGAARGRTSSLPRFVRALEAIDREHGPFDVWIGHSMGANAALTAVARGARVGRLVLIAALVRPQRALRGFAAGFGLTPEAAQAYLRSIERAEAMPLGEVDAERNAARVAAPTLLIHDRNDKVIPFGDAQALAAALPDVRFWPTDGLGHSRVLANAEVACAIARFAVADGTPG